MSWRSGALKLRHCDKRHESTFEQPLLSFFTPRTSSTETSRLILVDPHEEDVGEGEVVMVAFVARVNVEACDTELDVLASDNGLNTEEADLEGKEKRFSLFSFLKMLLSSHVPTLLGFRLRPDHSRGKHCAGIILNRRSQRCYSFCPCPPPSGLFLSALS